jgi:hypothetical protein
MRFQFCCQRAAPRKRELGPFVMDIILPGSQTPPAVAFPTAAKPLAGRI